MLQTLRTSSIPAWILIAVLVSFSLVKILSEYDQAYAIPEAVYYSIAVAEILLAASLALPATRHAGAWGVAILAVGSLAMTILLPSVNCGCGGALLPLTAREKAVIAFVMWILAMAIVRRLRTTEHEGSELKESDTSVSGEV